MRAVVQRVTRARVTVDNKVVGEIGHGLLVLLGVAKEDAETDADYLADKIIRLASLRGRQRQNELVAWVKPKAACWWFRSSRCTEM